ncbi:MAG TPA: prolyl oligopeptidase family serine peptidase [Verrucomicrobiae bacterium]|nr:prolyl oligopeptidase family serine peptidase [Verrucomicrobiae bacterium]
MNARALALLGVALLGGCGNSTPSSPPAAGAPVIPVACPAPEVVASAEVPCSERADPRLAEMSNDGILLASELGLPAGRYALPAASAPTQLVVFFHGHQNDSCSWRNHLRAAAAQGAVAVAMNYTGQEDREVPGFGFIENWGWAVRGGAKDSIAAARYFLNRYPSITEVYNFGTSMGGNVSGFAAYSPDAVRADCSPLWDWFIATEGVHNLTEEYTGARTLAPNNGAAAQAQMEIEEENGGSLEEVPAAFAEITNTANAADLGYLKGAVLVHGTSDQTVPVDQSRQMSDGLRAAGVPTHLFLVVGSDHVWEGNSDVAVMRTGLEELARLLAGGIVSDGETPVTN